MESFAGSWGNRLVVDGATASWIWEGYLLSGSMTLLTSQWKSGKTTLVSILLGRMKEGGELAGQPVLPGKAIVVSEESPEQWHVRHGKFDLGHVYFLCRPFCGKPRLDQWLGLIDHLAELHGRDGFQLLVLDTLASFLPGRNEAQASSMIEALAPLQRLCKLGMSTLLLHHPRKGEPLPGQAARGSGALAGFVDIILEMNWPNRSDPQDRRRRILAFSRDERTPAQRVIELNAEGTDYLTHGDFHDDDFAQNWSRLLMVLEDAAGKRTRRQLLEDWPADFPRPEESTLWRWLQRAARLGLILQEGSGRKNDPFRFWLPRREDQWKEDPMFEFQRMMEENKRKVLEDLDGAQRGAA
jgi:hypothetical protein